MGSNTRAVAWRAAALAAFLLAVIVAGLVIPVPTVEQIRASAESAGGWGAVFFVVGYGLITLTPIPKNVVSIAAGLTWGLAPGFVLVYAGALIGAALAFFLGRALGRDAVERFTGTRVARVDEILRRRGLLALIGARLVPILPFTVVNYTAGLTAVRRRDYTVGTMIGIVPGTLAYVAVGAFGTSLGWGFYVAVGALGLLALLGVILAYRMRKKSFATSSGPADEEAP
ncbi:putative membrane protein YdjX (TVP38/TMEM64 family) [Mycetocola sp. CAN_C7]|uniref:TVP38/TMEM64 family protein n=1 Tax=Mycetocola sp. CAN_C7 TaxID=2787724 RepID=UPI0018CBD5F8